MIIAKGKCQHWEIIWKGKCQHWEIIAKGKCQHWEIIAKGKCQHWEIIAKGKCQHWEIIAKGKCQHWEIIAKGKCQHWEIIAKGKCQHWEIIAKGKCQHWQLTFKSVSILYSIAVSCFQSLLNFLFVPISLLIYFYMPASVVFCSTFSIHAFRNKKIEHSLFRHRMQRRTIGFQERFLLRLSVPDLELMIVTEK